MFSKLGIKKQFQDYPSLFIGSFELSPYQAIQAYQTIAADGFYTPLRSIREIKDIKGEIEFSYPYSIEQRIRPEPVALLKFAMKQTFERGTARGYPSKTIESWSAGGKTGTSGQSSKTLSSIRAGYMPPITIGSSFIRSSESPN